MESSNGDGGSDASYESVASEGGYEPASERGRESLPRIISSSHCVAVFRRVRWADGTFCCHAAPSDQDAAGDKAAAQQGPPNLRPHDPLSGLPARVMHFRGALEAWLEEMPLPRDTDRAPRPYDALNDAASSSSPDRADLSILHLGNSKATLWFFTLEFLQQLWPLFLQPDGTGLKLWEQALLDRHCTIQSTHVKVGQVDCPPAQNAKARKQWLNSVFAAMQASRWTPDGEARAFIAKTRLSHASMSIGDAIQVGSELYVAGLAGFETIKQGARLLPLPAEPADGDSEPEEESHDADADAEAAVDGAPAEQTGKGRKGKGGGENGKKGGKGGGGKGDKDGGKGKTKGKGTGEGEYAARKERQPRAKEPAPVAKAAGGDQRVDRRKLRAQLQAKREEVQGCR